MSNRPKRRPSGIQFPAPRVRRVSPPPAAELIPARLGDRIGLYVDGEWVDMTPSLRSWSFSGGEQA